MPVVDGRPQLGEDLALLFLDVVADRLDQLLHRRAVLGGAGVELLEVGEEALGLLVLLDGLVGLDPAALDLGSNQRVDELLLDGGVHRQVVDDLLGQLIDRIGLLRQVHATEQLVDLSVVVLE